jgi:two-component system chemotaxis response regulator CheY
MMGRDRALVIIDDKGTRSAIKILLELNGIEVLSTDDAEQGLRKIYTDAFDIVLCDLDAALPTGCDIINKLRQQKSHYKTPIIALGAENQEKGYRDAMNLGADDIITTPFQGKILMAAVKARLELKRKYAAIHHSEIQDEVFSLLNKNVTQEMLTPLYGILNVTSLINSLPGIEDVESINELLSVIYESGFRMQRTMQNLRVYALLNTEGGTEVHKVNSNIFLKDILRTVVGHYENDLAPEVKKLEQEVLQVGAWEGQDELLKIIFTELIDNGIKFAADGHLPEVKLQAVSNNFTFSVTNYTTERITFNIDGIAPFKKFHKDLSRNGLGLGLFVVKTICEKMGYSFLMTKDGANVTFIVEN